MKKINRFLVFSFLFLFVFSVSFLSGCKKDNDKNEDYVKMALNIIDYSLKAGWDTENEGLKYFTDCLGKPVVQLECDLKLWWPHNEAIIATLYAYHITKDQKYYDWFEKL